MLWPATWLVEALERKTLEIESRIKRSQAAFSDLLEAPTASRRRSQAHTKLHHLICNLGADVEDIRRKKRDLED